MAVTSIGLFPSQNPSQQVYSSVLSTVTGTPTMQQQELEFVTATSKHQSLLALMEKDPETFSQTGNLLMSTSAELSKATDNLVEAYKQAGLLPKASDKVHDSQTFRALRDEHPLEWYAWYVSRRNGQTFLFRISPQRGAVVDVWWQDATDEAFATLIVQAKSNAGLLPKIRTDLHPPVESE